MPGAISDSSTLIHLAVLGRLGLLREYYGQVLVPPAVRKEVVEEGQGRAGAREVEDAAHSGWLKVLTPTNEALVRLLKRDLGDGEAEAIALAVEGQGDLILLDESDARRVATIYGLPKMSEAAIRVENSGSRLREDRETIFQALRAENIGVTGHYLPVHLHPYRGYRNGYHLQTDDSLA